MQVVSLTCPFAKLLPLGLVFDPSPCTTDLGLMAEG